MRFPRTMHPHTAIRTRRVSLPCPLVACPLVACLLLACLLPVSRADPISLSYSGADQAFAQGRFEEARQDYALAAKTSPATAAPRLNLIRTLLRMDRWPEAVAEAQGAAQAFPSSADAHGLLSLALIRAGWATGCADEAKKSLALDAGDYWGLVASGRLADWDGRREDARRIFRQAAALRPDLPDAWGDLLEMLDPARDAVEMASVSAAYVKLRPYGHPHAVLLEDARDFLDNAAAYERGFGGRRTFERPAPAPGAPGGGPDADESTTFPASVVGNYFVLPVTIDGVRYRLLFDTGGGGGITLNRRAAGKLNLTPLAHSFIRGVNGRESSETLRAESMTVGAWTYHAIRIETTSAVFTGFDGILGGNVFRDSRVTLDGKTSAVTLERGAAGGAPAARPGNRSAVIPLHPYHGGLFAAVSVNQVPVWALTDTGASDTMLSLRLAADQLKAVPPGDSQRGSVRERHGVGDSDRKTDYIASPDESTLTLSRDPPVSITLPTVGATDMDRQVSPSVDFEVGLFLGMSSLLYAERLTFDYPRHQLTFEFVDPDAAPAAPTKK